MSRMQSRRARVATLTLAGFMLSTGAIAQPPAAPAIPDVKLPDHFSELSNLNRFQGFQHVIQDPSVQMRALVLQKITNDQAKERIGDTTRLLYLSNFHEEFTRYYSDQIAHDTRKLPFQPPPESLSQEMLKAKMEAYRNARSLSEFAVEKYGYPRPRRGNDSVADVVADASSVLGAIPPFAMAAGATGAIATIGKYTVDPVVDQMNYERRQAAFNSKVDFFKIPMDSLLNPLEGMSYAQALQIVAFAKLDPQGFQKEIESSLPRGFFEGDPFAMAKTLGIDEKAPKKATDKKVKVALKQMMREFDQHSAMILNRHGRPDLAKAHHLMAGVSFEVNPAIDARPVEKETEEQRFAREKKEAKERTDKLAVLERLHRILGTAEALAGDDKNARATIAIMDTTVQVAAEATAEMSTAALSLGVVGLVAALGYKLYSIFSSTKSRDEIILDQLADLQRKLIALTNKMENAFDRMERQISSLTLYINQEFDNMKRLVRGESMNLKERVQNVEALTRLGAQMEIHEGKADQTRFQEIIDQKRIQLYKSIHQAKKMRPNQDVNAATDRLFGNYAAAMTELAYSAAFLSRGNIQAGAPLPSGRVGKGVLARKMGDDAASPIDRSRAYGLYIPIRNGASDTALVFQALEKSGLPIVSPEYCSSYRGDDLALEFAGKYKGPLNPVAWHDNVLLWASAANAGFTSHPSAKLYRQLLDQHDTDLTEHRLLMDAGYEQLHALQALAPLDSSGRPSVLHLFPLFAAYESALKGVAAKVDKQFVQKVANAAGTLQGYDPRIPIENQKLRAHVTEDPAFATGKGVFTACPGYTPLAHDGSEMREFPLVMDRSRIREFIFKVPKEILLAKDILGGEINWCYRNIRTCNETQQYRSHSHNHHPERFARDLGEKGRRQENILIEVRGNLCVDLEGSYTSAATGAVAFLRETAVKQPAEFIREETWMPVFDHDYGHYMESSGYLPEPTDPANKEVYRRVMQAALTHQGDHGKFAGLQYRGHTDSGTIAERLVQETRTSWDQLQAQLLASETTPTVDKKVLEQERARVYSQLREMFGRHFQAFIQEDLLPDAKDKIGEVGKALDELEKSRILLTLGLYYALGDGAFEDPEIRAALGALAGSGDAMYYVAHFTDVNLRDAHVTNLYKPAARLLQLISDLKRPPITKRWAILQDPLERSLEPLYLRRKALLAKEGVRVTMESRAAELVSSGLSQKHKADPQHLTHVNRMTDWLMKLPEMRGEPILIAHLLSELTPWIAQFKDVSEEELKDLTIDYARFWLQLVENPKGPRFSKETLAMFLGPVFKHHEESKSRHIRMYGASQAQSLIAFYQFLRAKSQGNLSHEAALGEMDLALRSIDLSQPEDLDDQLKVKLEGLKGVDLKKRAAAAEKLSALGKLIATTDAEIEKVRGLPQHMWQDGVWSQHINAQEVATARGHVQQMEVLLNQMRADKNVLQTAMDKTNPDPNLKDLNGEALASLGEKLLAASEKRSKAALLIAPNVRHLHGESGRRCHEWRVNQHRMEAERRSRRNDR